MRRAWISLLVAAGAAGLAVAACSGAPVRGAPWPPETVTEHAARAPSSLDPCREEPGGPAPEPLERVYDGVLARARCRRELESIMQGLNRALGVECDYCHRKDDYRAPTERKRVANWMARELAPRLRTPAGADVACADCHAVSGRGSAKLLGTPRSTARAAEWMNTHLVAAFTDRNGRRLRCKACHGGNFGAPAFQPKLILRGELAGLPRDPASVVPVGDAGITPQGNETTPPASDAGTPDAGAPP